jgi:hypothetical protein
VRVLSTSRSVIRKSVSEVGMPNPLYSGFKHTDLPQDLNLFGVYQIRHAHAGCRLIEWVQQRDEVFLEFDLDGVHAAASALFCQKPIM